MRDMEILTAEEMRIADARADSEHGISSRTLMDNAGRELAGAIRREAGEGAPGPILILCGKGNNGGDGITAARHLAAAGIRARVALLAEASSLRREAAWALTAARSAGVEIEEVATDAQWEALRRVLPEQEIIVDALLGTGTTGPARGRILDAIRALNASGSRVISVDIPSGLSGSSAEPAGPCVEASLTLALAALKIPHAFPPASRFAGRVEVLDIGIPMAAIEAAGSGLRWTGAREAALLIRPREPDSHKGNYGHVLILAGSCGRSGAATLMARACLRSGAGLVTVAAPESAQRLIASATPEIMTEPLPESPQGALSPAALDRVIGLTAGAGVLAVGPGLGTGEGAAAIVPRIAWSSRIPTILDADALNVIAEAGLQGPLSPGGRLVLTPHPGEAARLLGCTTAEVQSNRVTSARRLAAERACTVLLKGNRSLVADAEGIVRVNPTGNPGMATAGSGDVLAGVVAAWLAQGLGAADAATLAAYAHGLAGDHAARRLGRIGMTAGDIVEALPLAWRELCAE
jgi:NAD(P)H-hydrate epimerase